MTVSPVSAGHEEMMARFVIWRKVGRCPCRGYAGCRSGPVPSRTPPPGIGTEAAVCPPEDEKGEAGIDVSVRSG
jgi:hypothetical protein